MMNRFPVEILILIFKHLHFKQKLECMLVCRAWAQVLLQGYLFETSCFSYLPPSKPIEKHFIPLLRKIKKGSYPGEKFKRLLIDNTSSSDVDAALLATSFPNLSFFYSGVKLIYNPESRRLRSTTLDPNPFLGWRTNLETLIDVKCNTKVLLSILDTGVFSRLTTLKVHPYSFEIIPLLKNTPMLKNLWINLNHASLNHLEDLHKTVQLLESLTLVGAFSLPRAHTVLLDVVPAEELKTLTLINAGWHDLIPNSDLILSYIKIKYTRLNEFIWKNDDQSICNTYGQRFSDSKFAEFLTVTGPGLKKCIFSLKGLSAETVNLIERHMVQLETLGTDMSGCLDFFKNVTSVRKTTNKMPIKLIKDTKSTLKSINLKKLTQLKELTLEFPRILYNNGADYIIFFGKILNNLPETLHTLRLEGNGNSVFQEREAIQCISNVVDLTLRHMVISGSDLSTLLSRYFPKLKSLVVDSCISKNSDGIELPRQHLHYFEFIPHRSSGFVLKDKVHFKVTISGKTLYYKVPIIYGGIHSLARKRMTDNHDRSIQQVLYASPDSGNSLNTFHLQCGSVETVYCCNYLLLL